MAGEKTVAPTNGMQNILSLLQTIAGTETKTTGTANIGPLQSVMDQIAASQGTQGQQLLESIFSQAAGAVPGIMGNTFNASGSRAPNNVMAGTLQKLMADVTKQAQAQLVQQQQNAQQMQLQAASQIANATRGQRQVQKSGASDFITKAGKVLTANKAIKGLTGKDYVQKTADALSSLFRPEIPSYTLGNGFAAPLYGGATLGDFTASADLPSIAGLGFTSPMGTTADSLPLYTSGTDMPTGSLSSMPTDTSGGDALSGISFGGADSVSTAPSLSSSLSLSTPSSYSDGSLYTSGADTSYFGDGDAGDFSYAGGDSGSAASSAATYLKAYGYATDPNKRKDVFDFSDGDFADDAGDIADVAAFAFPLAAFVRPALTLADEAEDTVTMMAKDPYKWASNLLQGDDPALKGVWDYAGGAIGGTWDAIADLGSDVGDFVGGAVENVGDFFGDVFGW